MTARAGVTRQAPDTVSRFAPSPTGRLHLGHALSAMKAHDLAKARGGRFLLRIEDIDPTRCREAFIDGIVEDLEWLGLHWDGEIIRQSARLPLYSDALERLRAKGLVYPCFCTRSEIAAEIAASGAAPHGPYGALYPGTCRLLDPSVREQRMANMPHAWRLDVMAAQAMTGPLEWQDEFAGLISARPEIFGDVVLARKDAPTSYHLAVTVDDAAQGITDIVRGEDLLAATHVHRLLQALLELPEPRYHHHALVTDASGKRLAKRDRALTLEAMRIAGTDPSALLDSLRAGEIAVGRSSEKA